MWFTPEFTPYGLFKIRNSYPVQVPDPNPKLACTKPCPGPCPNPNMINLLRIDEHVNIVETVFVWFCFDTNFFNEITF